MLSVMVPSRWKVTSLAHLTDDEIEAEWKVSARYTRALDNERERRAEAAREARGLRARGHSVEIHTRYGDTTRECYCNATEGYPHHEDDSPWITSSGVVG